MMIFDSHVHLKHGDVSGTEYSPKTIVEIMDEVGIDKSVVFAMSTTTMHSIELAERAAQRFPDRLIPYVYALPHYERPVLREIEEAISKRDFQGIKIHAGECTLAEYVIDPVLDIACKYDVPCLIDYCGNSGAAERMASRRESKIIVAHMGKYLCTDEGLIDRFIRIAEEHNNVFLDVSGVVMLRKIRDALRRIGSNRIIFGTDGPHESPDAVSFARTELGKIDRLNLNEKEREDIFAGSITTLLRMECGT